MKPPETTATVKPSRLSVRTRVRAPGVSRTRRAHLVEHARPAGPARTATRVGRLSAKSSSPRIAAVVTSATSASRPAWAASSSITSSWIRVESTSMTTRRRPRRASPAGATAMSTPWTCDSRASSRRRDRTSAPETSNSTVVTGYRESRRMRSMLAPWAAIRAVTAATALASRGAPSTTTATRAAAPWRVVTGAGAGTATVSPSPAATSATTVRSRSSAPAPGSEQHARASDGPRTTTCSRSSTSAPTSAMASNRALVTPGRSSPETVTSRVGALRGSGTRTA